MFSWDNLYSVYINLKHRVDRKELMEKELVKHKIPAKRYEAIRTKDHHWDKNTHLTMFKKNMQNAIGCYYSQVGAMKEALAEGKNAFIMEDDIVFCADFEKRKPIIADFLNKNEWDVFWLGSTFHKTPTWHRLSQDGTHTHPSIKGICDCRLNADWADIGDKNIVRTYGCWSTYAYLVNVSSVEKILKMLNEKLYLSHGIDHTFIMIQPQLKTYAFNVGCVKQYDNKSDIGHGVSYFSNFKILGKHWYSETMQNT